MKYDSVIFDMDGTLWDSRKGICEAWNQSFARQECDRRISVEELTGYMGLPMNEIAMRMFPGKEYAEVKSIFDCCMNDENTYLMQHGGILYPDLINTLEALSQKCRLYIVSNCQSGYIEAFFNAHKTSQYFKDIECYGNTGMLKDHNIALLVKRNGLQSPVYVGDTQGDADSAERSGVDFIYASYGFGHVANPQYSIDSFGQLTDIIQ